MGVGGGVGYALNIYAFGLILIPCLAAWDRFIFTGNTLIAMHLMDQSGATTLFNLTIMINAIAFIFLVAGAYNLIVQAKSEANKQV